MWNENPMKIYAKNHPGCSLQEGIQEYESRDNLSCSSCIFYDKGFCEKGLLMTENCPEYWD